RRATGAARACARMRVRRPVRVRGRGLPQHAARARRRSRGAVHPGRRAAGSGRGGREARMSTVVELQGVSVEFRTGWGANRRQVTAMSDVSFAIAPGETLGLVGESGSGKTTTGSAVLG